MIGIVINLISSRIDNVKNINDSLSNNKNLSKFKNIFERCIKDYSFRKNLFDNLIFISDQGNKVLSYLKEFIASSSDLDKSNLDIDNSFLDKINKFASIKHISENVKKDETKLIEIFEEMKKDLNNISIDIQISDLESKFSKDLSENTFNKIIELKKLQNTN